MRVIIIEAPRSTLKDCNQSVLFPSRIYCVQIQLARQGAVTRQHQYAGFGRVDYGTKASPQVSAASTLGLSRDRVHQTRMHPTEFMMSAAQTDGL